MQGGERLQTFIISTKVRANPRHVTHIPLSRSNARTRLRKSPTAHAAQLIFENYQTIHAQTVSPQYPRAVVNAQKKGYADINVLEHVTRAHVHHVMKKWFDLVDVVKVNLLLDAMYSEREWSKV
jgi:hypothetical protein